jgi:hypothetical protein
VVAPDVPAEPALVAPGALPLGLPPWMPPVLPAELLGPDGAEVSGVVALGLLFVVFEPLGLDAASGVVVPLLTAEPDGEPLMGDADGAATDPLLFDEAPLPVDELLSIELDGPLVSEDPVDSPEVLVPAAPPVRLVPPPPVEPADPPLIPAVPPPLYAPPAPPPPAAPAAAIRKSPPGDAALTPETGRATRATPASK